MPVTSEPSMPAQGPEGNKRKLIFGSLIAVTVLIGGYFMFFKESCRLESPPDLYVCGSPFSKFLRSFQKPIQIDPKTKNGMCTREAKMCPDGSYVGRSGPQCEFAACSGKIDTSGWQTYRNKEYGFELTFTNAWKGYRAVERADNYNPAIHYIDLQVPATDKTSKTGIGWARPMGIAVYPINIWNSLNQELIKEGREPGTELQRNGTYVFSAFYWQDPPSDLGNIDFEFAKILSTFRFTELNIGTISISVSDLIRSPVDFLDRKIKVSGLLINTKESYFPNPEFAISDQIGSQTNFTVTPWLPLEVPPPVPGSTQQPVTMQSYINKIVTLVGIVKEVNNSFFLQVLSGEHSK